MKVLWVGDAVITSGFSVVTHNICNELSKLCDLTVFGIGYDGRVRHPCPFYIYPGRSSQDLYSLDFASKIIARENPNVVVLFNDLPVVHAYLDKILEIGKSQELQARIVPLFPLNYVPPDKLEVLALSTKGITDVLTYTGHSKSSLSAINPQLNISAIYHGVDIGTYFPIESAKYTLGLKDQFVVGNVNSNSYRKRLDLFMKGFAKFAQDKSDVKCIVHATGSEMAYDLGMIAKDLNIAEKTILSSSNLKAENLNSLYNVMDVNVNTSMGEGFGLSLVEGAACGVPILCPKHGNLVDIWGDNATYIKIKESEYVPGTRFVGATIDINDMAKQLNNFYEDRNLLLTMGNNVKTHATSDRFDWKRIAEKVYGTITSVNKGRLSFIW